VVEAGVQGVSRYHTQSGCPPGSDRDPTNHTMRIFLTGATGYIGSAVLEALLRAGHEVTALVRNSERAAIVTARGGRPVVGDMGEPASYRDAAQGHAAFVHAAFENSPRGPEVERTLLDTLAPVARQTPGAVFVYTSGVWVLGRTRKPATEESPVNPPPVVAFRPGHERLVLEAAGDGLRSLVVRPGIVYGGSRGIVADMFRDAANGLMRVIGSGENHWPLVYDRDLGELYVRLIAQADASGIFHANDEGDERVNDIVEAVAQHGSAKADVRHVPLAEARTKMGPVADALVLDQIVRSPRARALGWAPSLHRVSRNVARLSEEWRSGRETA
jgi:nucleoside-diphosphate-sugar epimerase